MAITAVSNVIVPEIFTPYVQLLTEEKSRLIASGALVREASLDALLAGGGLTFNVPSWKDLANDVENISTDTTYDYDGGDNSTPKNTGAVKETAVRLSRNQSWSTAALAGSLAGSDPMNSIAQRVSAYWSRRLQAAFLATMVGVFADNDAAPAGTEHTEDDLTHDIKAGAYSAGVTDFSAEAFIDTTVLMGDSMEDLGIVLVHSVVYARMQKNNLIDFIPDSEGRITIPTFLGRQVIVDDSMPVSAGVYHSYLLGAGAVRLGVGTPPNATETARMANAGNGGGQDVLHSRVEWTIHPVGHAYVGTPAAGGPSNATSANNLGHVDSWVRRFPERKQIKIARLITRES